MKRHPQEKLFYSSVFVNVIESTNYNIPRIQTISRNWKAFGSHPQWQLLADHLITRATD
jgi:hypothetical protein